MTEHQKAAAERDTTHTETQTVSAESFKRVVMTSYYLVLHVDLLYCIYPECCEGVLAEHAHL